MINDVEIVLTPNPVWTEMTGAEQAVTWVLPGLLPEGVLLVLGGLPGAGKSLLSYALGMGMATGTPVLGFTPPRPFRVCYFDEENTPADRKTYQRWAGWGLGLTEAHAELVAANFVGYSFHLGHARWNDVVETAVRQVNPDVMIFDTATACFAIEDENDNAEATQTVNEIRRLQRLCTPTATALVLKHAKTRTQDGDGHETTYTLRGAKAWEGAVDGTLFQVKARGRGFYDEVLRKTLHVTRLVPGKVRAHGLSAELVIQPKGVQTPQGVGLQLRRGSRQED